MSKSRLVFNIGDKFGKLTVVKFSHLEGKGALWVFNCDCGNDKIAYGFDVKSGKVRSCGCLQNEYRTNPKRVYRTRPFEALFNRFVRAAKQAGKDIHINYEEFLAFTHESKCYYCHDLIEWIQFITSERKNKSGSKIRYNLDRKNNAIGYTKENCVVCCKRCNWSRCDRYSHEEWYEMCRPWREGILTHSSEDNEY